MFGGKFTPGGMTTFNMDDGYIEATLRGYMLGLLSTTDYHNLCQCERLDDIKMHLQSTSYGSDFLANEPTPEHSTTIAEACVKHMVKQFNYLRANAVKPLSTFLDYITYGYMIDNVALLITGTLRESDLEEIKAKCHPLGKFDAMQSIVAGHNIEELYNEVLVDTPLASYIQGCLSEADLDELNIEVIRNTLFKAYLEDFHRFCTEELGGVTGEVMDTLLRFESDRRSINITLNSFGTELTKDDRQKLYPSIGSLEKESAEALSHAESEDHVKEAVAHHFVYRNLFDQVDYDQDKTLEDAFFEYEVKLNLESFERQFGYGIFYSYFKLKEQEIRNILWISECILQNQPDEINRYVPIEVVASNQ